jgi:hypothetical protein
MFWFIILSRHGKQHCIHVCLFFPSAYTKLIVIISSLHARQGLTAGWRGFGSSSFSIMFQEGIVGNEEKHDR